MNTDDPLKAILVEFFELAPDTKPEQLTQKMVKKWDSVATVQLITQLEMDFQVTFSYEEIEKLTSYAQIRDILASKGISL